MSDDSRKNDSAKIFARSDTPLYNFFGALLCVILAAAICLGGIYLIQRRGPSPRYAAEHFSAAESAEEAASGEASGEEGK